MVFLLFIRQINNYGTQRLFFTTRLWDRIVFLLDFDWSKRAKIETERQNSFEDNGGRLKVEMEPSTAATALTTALTTTSMVKVTALERIETFITVLYIYDVITEKEKGV